MKDQAARIRTGTATPVPPSGSSDPRIGVDLSHLRRLEARYGADCFQRGVLVAPDHRLAARRYVKTRWRA